MLLPLRREDGKGALQAPAKLHRGCAWWTSARLQLFAYRRCLTVVFV
jgi:hypothetical protein